MVHFSKSFILFLKEEKEKGSAVARLILSGLSDYYPVQRNILTNKEVDYVTLRGDGLISYLPAGKEHVVNSTGDWARDNRQTGKPAKVIRKVFTEKILRFMPAKEFETFGNAYKAKFMDNGFRFEMRPNIDIPTVYNLERAEGGASLNTSCMNGDTDYLMIYKKCKHVRILTMLSKDGLLCGRALVWNVRNDEFGDIIFMDRIYVAEDYMYDLFLEHAKSQGWWRKSSFRNFENKLTWINPVTDKSHTVYITIDTDTDFNYYPYIDTFSYGYDGRLNNSGGDYGYSNTDGTRDDNTCHDDDEREDDHSGQIWDEINNEYIDEDDAVFLCNQSERRFRGRHVHCRDAVEAYIRRTIQDWFHENDENIVEVSGEWYHKEHDDIVRRADGEYDMRENCVECETDNEWYTSDDSDLIQSESGEYYHKHNDDNVIRIQPKTCRGKRKYMYLPDVEGSVVQGMDNLWYYYDDKRITELDVHDECNTQWVFKIDLIKWGKRRYHKSDSRLVSLITSSSKRKAHKK